MIEIEEYRRDNLSSPFDEWFSSLSVPAATRVTTALVRLEMGNTSNIKWCDGFGGGDKSSQKRDIKVVKSLINEHQRDKKLKQKR